MLHHMILPKHYSLDGMHYVVWQDVEFFLPIWVTEWMGSKYCTLGLFVPTFISLTSCSGELLSAGGRCFRQREVLVFR